MEYIQPLVLTTSPLFTGWVCDTVPVFGGPAIVGLLHEINVTYRNEEGEVLMSQQHTSAENFTINEFISYIYNPIQWRIAAEGDDIEHIKSAILDINFNIPQIKDK